MYCRLADLRCKEVISIKDGTRIGYVNDVEVDIKCARIIAIIIYGRLKCFGLFGRADDIIIKWENLEVIGDDTILVDFNIKHGRRRKIKFFDLFFKK